MRANVRSHSFLAYSSRSPEVFPVFHRETLYHSDQKKTSRILLMREKQERETFTGNPHGEGALCAPVTFYRKEYLQYVLPIIRVDVHENVHSLRVARSNSVTSSCAYKSVSRLG